MPGFKSLEEHNKLAAQKYDTNNSFQRNNIECPTCGAELMDSSSNVVLASMPPLLNVHCSSPNCDFKGYRVQ